MPAYVPTRRQLTASLKTFLKNNSSRPFEVLRAPNKGVDVMKPEDMPYGVIVPGNGIPFSGPWLCFPEAEVGYEYQISSYGLREDQADWMADMVRNIMLGRESNGNFSYSLTSSGLTVQDREALSTPTPVQKSGMVYYVVDSYLIRVTTR